MKKKWFRGLFLVAALFLVPSLAFAGTDFRTDGDEPGYWMPPKKGQIEDYSYKAFLEPGMGTFCGNDFIVHNRNQEKAELAVIVGGKASMEEVKPKSTLAYDLTSGFNPEDEARIVNSGKSPIMVECK